MLQELMQSGLSEKEAKVYLASLELGRATADQIAKHARVNRSTTYVQIESLMRAGLMTTFDEGKKTFFAPESPTQLANLIALDKADLAGREHAVRQIVPSLQNLFEQAGERPVARFFEGKEGLIAIREEIFSAKEKHIYVISSFDAVHTVFSDEEMDAYSARRAEKGIQLELIYTRKDGPISEPAPAHTKRCFISPGQLPITTDILLFDDVVLFMNLQGKINGVFIRSSSMHESLRAIFGILWNVGKEQ